MHGEVQIRFWEGLRKPASATGGTARQKKSHGRVCEGRSPEEIQRMEEENALPHGWENMPYEDFLIERRKLMAAKIKAAFEQLKKNVE